MKVHSCYVNVDSHIAKINKTAYLDKAANIAKKSVMTQKHGCIIVYKKQIIASAYNTMPKSFGDSVHAEINAINKVKDKKILKQCELYIVRIGTSSMNNPLKYSKPCKQCTDTIINFNIRKIYYSTNFEYDQCRLCGLS